MQTHPLDYGESMSTAFSHAKMYGVEHILVYTFMKKKKIGKENL